MLRRNIIFSNDLTLTVPTFSPSRMSSLFFRMINLTGQTLPMAYPTATELGSIILKITSSKWAKV